MRHGVIGYVLWYPVLQKQSSLYRQNGAGAERFRPDDKLEYEPNLSSRDVFRAIDRPRILSTHEYKASACQGGVKIKIQMKDQPEASSAWYQPVDSRERRVRRGASRGLEDEA